MNRSYVSSLRI